MPDLPKSVVGRMKAQAAPEQHPDTNLLAAFSEQALTGRERESVLAHLAVCTACREAVSLASPPPAAVQPGGVFIPWYRRPQIFAWAGSLATVALVGALILNYARSGDRDFVVTDATPAKVVATPPAENKPAQTPQSSLNDKLESDKRAEPLRRDANVGKEEREQKKNKADEEHALLAKPSASAQIQAPAKDEKKLDGGVLQNQYSVMKEAAAPPPPPTAPAARATNATNEKQQAAAAAETVTVESAARPETADLAASGGTVGGLRQSKAAKVAVAAPRWSVTDKGRLQRSLDSGRTWQPQLAAESTVFRAVAVVGNDVWAGGTAAALFHSADGGSSWTRQVLPGASADVVSLQFADAQHGTARTTDGITWTTADGGQRWTKQ